MKNARTRRYPGLLAILFSVGLSATAAQGQTSIADGQTMPGRLEAGDRRLDDDSYFDLYIYRGQPGERIVITLRSTDFDAYLAGGTLTGPSLVVRESDDDGAGGTDARLEVTVGESGNYGIRANSLFEHETGEYTLTVERAHDVRSTESAVRIRAGQLMSGKLEPDDPRMTDGSYFDLYRYVGRPGDRIVITMRSDAFDTYLSWGRMDDGRLIVEHSDDDGAGGTDSQLMVTVHDEGSYVIRANSLFPERTGHYIITVEGENRTRTTVSGIVAFTGGAAE